MSQTKVLHISPAYKPAYLYGGPVISVSQLCEGQAALGAEVSVFATAANGKSDHDLPRDQPVWTEGVKVFYYKRDIKYPLHLSFLLLQRLYHQARYYDVIHIHSWWNFLCMLAVLICKLRGIKPVLAPRGMLGKYTFEGRFSFFKKVLHILVGKWLLKNTLFHATAHTEQVECMSLIPSWKGFILPNSIIFPKKEYKKSINSTFTVCFVSRIDPKKGLEILLKAIALLNSQVKLLIVGEGIYEYKISLKNLANSLGIETQVEWLGWQQGEKKFKHMASADIMVLPSYNENFANVVIEALSVGTAVVISDKVGLHQYVADNNFGWVCKTNVNSLLDNLAEACHNVERRNKVFLSAPMKVMNDFSVKNIAKKSILKYEEMLNL
ncbi:MAG: glycosyltransferase [Bacteroidota bacterium]